VAVLPEQRDLLLILMLKRIGSNGPAIGALEIGLSGPTSEIWFHFDFPFQNSF
jgi:hypothetical protein